MACEGFFDLNPLCLPIKAAQATAGAAQSVTSGAFGVIAGFFRQAATSATTWLWQQISDATSVELTSPKLLQELAATGAIAAVLCLALFIVQLVGATLRGHPVRLGRAVTGLMISFVGSAFALGTTRLLLGAVDALSDGVVQFSLGTNIDGLSARFGVAQLSGIHNPAAVILLSLVILIAVVMVWGAMMIRKLMLIVAAVLAPIAFAGATADFARGWVRKWIEFVAAMIASKLLLVIILSLGVAVVNGAGQDGTGGGQAVTQLAAGSLILLLGGFAPWMAIRMFHFAGDSLYAAHSTARASAAGAQSAITAPQKVAALTSSARALGGAGSRGMGWAGMGGPPSSPRPAPAGLPAPTGMPLGSVPGPVGPVASSGGAAAATSAAGPSLGAAGAVVGGLKAAVNKVGQVGSGTGGDASQATSTATSPSTGVPSTPPGGTAPARPPTGPPRQPPTPPPPPPDTGSRS